MAILKWTAFAAIALMGAAAASAQQKFPLRSGEWAVTTSVAGSDDAPTPLLYCFNDEIWQKALTQDPLCSVQQFNLTSSGASYALSCSSKFFQMAGHVILTFDGMEHMTAKGKIDMTMSGKTTTSLTQSDYHWKGGTCSPNDMNLRPKRTN